MNEEILQNIILISIFVEILMIVAIVYMQFKIYNYQKKVYFIKRDRERLNEILYSVKDGHFCFVYPDEKIRDPQKGILERCSRRLSVMMNLKNGTASSFAEICDMFYKEDARTLHKYIQILQQEGKFFDDILQLKSNHRYFYVYGSRINGLDNNLYCDIVWFRDITSEMEKITDLQEEKNLVQNEVKRLEDMIDGLNYPLWLRDENLNIIAVNKKYLEYSGENSKKDIVRQNVEIINTKGEKLARKIAAEAQKIKKLQKKTLSMTRGGGLYTYEVQERPYFIGDSLDKIGTVGFLADNTELEKVKRSYKVNQDSHLQVLQALGTAFAIFDNKTRLFFYNNAFHDLWGLDSAFLEKNPTYQQFLDIIREHKILPPVPDFNAYKEEEMQVFKNLLETREDLLHLPDGRTIRRFRTPHPNGIIFAFEDVSDRLATMRRLNDLTSMQQSILDNLTDSVIIFGANQRLKFYNRSYLKLWGLDFDKLQDEPKLEKILEWQKLFFSHLSDWKSYKQTMLDSILDGKKFNIIRDDDMQIKVSPLIFYDGSIMITYSENKSSN